MTATGQDVTRTRSAAGAAVQRASQILLARQDKQGWWSGRSVGDVTLEAEALLVAEVLGIRTAETTNAAAQQIRSLQQAGRAVDWRRRIRRRRATGRKPPGTCPRPCWPISRCAWRAIRPTPTTWRSRPAGSGTAGGVAAAGVLARTWLALFGLAEWSDVPVPAPELSYLPGRYAASRPAAVALSIIGTLRPIRPLPIDLSELQSGDHDSQVEAAAPDAAAGGRRRPSRTRRRCAAAGSGSSAGSIAPGCQRRAGPAGRAHSWRCTCSGTRSTIRCWPRACPGSARPRLSRARRRVDADGHSAPAAGA